MSTAGFVIAFADINTSLGLHDLAAVLSSHVFGGIPFVDKDVDEDYQLGTLCLAHDFIGIQVDLFGGTGMYTLEISTRPSASVGDLDDVCDLSAMLKQRIRTQCQLHVE